MGNVDLSVFLAGNIVEEATVLYAATNRFRANGEPVKWELRAITSEQDVNLRKDHYMNVAVEGKNNQFKREFDGESYLVSLAVRTIIYPDLNDKELQDSYKVMGADKLLLAMLRPGEYQQLLSKVHEVNGFNNSINTLVKEAKN